MEAGYRHMEVVAPSVVGCCYHHWLLVVARVELEDNWDLLQAHLEVSSCGKCFV